MRCLACGIALACYAGLTRELGVASTITLLEWESFPNGQIAERSIF